jgi:hypothetical protein
MQRFWKKLTTERTTMRSYSWGQSQEGLTAFLTEGPWWSFLLDNLMVVCDYVPAISLPPIPMKDDEGKPTTWREWYGDTHTMFHLWVCVPVSQFVYRHQRDFRIPVADKEALLDFLGPAERAKLVDD